MKYKRMVSCTDFKDVLVQEWDLNYSGKSTKLLSLNPILGNDVIDSEEESPSIFEENPTRKKPDREKAEFLTLNRSCLSPLCFHF